MSLVENNTDRSKDTSVFVVDRAGDRKADLNTANVATSSKRLNDYGSASFSMPADDPKNAKVELGKTEIQIWEGDVMWWGIVSRARTTPEETSYDCDEILYYYDFRFVLNASLEYTSLDQVTIATNIHLASQTGTLRSFNIDTGSFPLSGRIRSRIYDRDEHPNVLEMLKEFSGLDDGFDISVEYDGTGLREFWCHYPRKGIERPKLKLEWGRNIMDFDVGEDATRLATRVYATGGSNGEVKFEENFQDDVAAAALGTHYEDVVSDGSQKDVDWLLDRAVEEVNERKVPLIIPELVVVDEPVQVYGVVEVGDTLPVLLQYGRLAIAHNYRILEIVRNHQARTNTLQLARDTTYDA